MQKEYPTAELPRTFKFVLEKRDCIVNEPEIILFLLQTVIYLGIKFEGFLFFSKFPCFLRLRNSKEILLKNAKQ